MFLPSSLRNTIRKCWTGIHILRVDRNVLPSDGGHDFVLVSIKTVRVYSQPILRVPRKYRNIYANDGEADTKEEMSYHIGHVRECLFPAQEICDVYHVPGDRDSILPILDFAIGTFQVALHMVHKPEPPWLG